MKPENRNDNSTMYNSSAAVILDGQAEKQMLLRAVFIDIVDSIESLNNFSTTSDTVHAKSSVSNRCKVLRRRGMQ